ncbi:MAG: hypothetical protein OEW45_03830 [Deltaproteobacteria bacterium]|jgi:Tol biopolymer transport system component|nr:hypothetical protein [Deltaproteobacteria bacterium]
MKKTVIQIVLLSLLIFLLPGAVPAADARFGGKIAFLRSGENWLADQNGRNIRRVTDTGGKVEDFLFSPSLSYVVYSRENRVYRYSLDTRKADLILENAAKPVFFTFP